MDFEKVKQQIEDWVRYCEQSPEILDLPYIDSQVEIDGRFEEIFGDFRRHGTWLISAWRNSLEGRLLDDPANRALRFAALYPFLEGGLSNPYNIPHSLKDLRPVFHHFAGLCIPDKITSLADLRFELYNQYLAANWERADEIWRRIALLRLLPFRELYLFRGQFWFISVFGRRIEFELSNPNFEYEFYWCWPLTEKGEGSIGFFTFARPECLTWGSPAHWVLTAWCTNPRAPKAVVFPLDPLFFRDPDEARPEGGGPQSKAGQELALFEHEQYREFEPIAPPELSPKQHTRLRNALADLREGFSIDQEINRSYLPLIARTLFCLGRFEEAAEAYDALAKAGPSLQNPINGEPDHEWEWLLCFHRCVCLRRAGQPDAAIDALAQFGERQAIRLPDPINKNFRTWGTGWWIAKWHSEQGRYLEAAQYLKAELDSYFSPPESWQLSTILVLESVARDEAALAATTRQYIADRPDIQQIMTGIISDMWPTYGSLSPDSALHWLSAVHLSFGECPLKDLKNIWLSNAVREYGWVLEQELKARIFSVFFEEVRSNPDRRLRRMILVTISAMSFIGF